MLELDGCDGGGQMVRTAVALSALSGEAVRVEDVRGDRPEPGMKPQHVAAVEAAAALCSATVEGDTAGAGTLLFRPSEAGVGDSGEPTDRASGRREQGERGLASGVGDSGEPTDPTEVTVDVDTAGSIALVFDTVLPLATALTEPVSVTVTAGTDVKWAPPVDYLRYVKLPLLATAGLDADLSVGSRGFYPLGGGEATLTLRPSTLEPLSAVDRGDLRRVEVHSVAAADLADAEVAERQAAAAADRLDAATPVGAEATYAETDCAGSVVVLIAVYEGGRGGFTALGEAGKPSETVAAEAVDAFERFHEGAAAVDEHLADQLQVPLALAGGEVAAPEATAHVRTNRAVVEAFGHDLSVEQRGDRVVISG